MGKYRIGRYSQFPSTCEPRSNQTDPARLVLKQSSELAHDRRGGDAAAHARPPGPVCRRKKALTNVFRHVSGSQRVAPQPNGPVITIPLAESRVGSPLKSCESPRRSGGAKTAVWGAGGAFQVHLGPFRRQVGYQNDQSGPTKLAIWHGAAWGCA